MAEYVELNRQKPCLDYASFFLSGRPNPWGEALKGMYYVKKLPYTHVRKHRAMSAALRLGPVRVVRPSLFAMTSVHAARGLSNCT